jgi:hypothetical protein
VAGRVLLCHFHVMKAWSENLLTCVPIPDKKKLVKIFACFNALSSRGAF